jgi:hypothetical protein
MFGEACKLELCAVAPAYFAGAQEPESGKLQQTKLWNISYFNERLEMEKLSWMIWTEPLGTGHKVITRGEWRINEISSTYFHTLPKINGNIFVTPFNVSENFYIPPLQLLTGSNGVSLIALSLTIQMYQICTPKFHGYWILLIIWHWVRLKHTILCVDLIVIIVKQFFPNLNLGTNHPRPQAQARAALTVALGQAVDLRRNSDAEAWSHSICILWHSSLKTWRPQWMQGRLTTRSNIFCTCKNK